MVRKNAVVAIVLLVLFVFISIFAWYIFRLRSLSLREAGEFAVDEELSDAGAGRAELQGRAARPPPVFLGGRRPFGQHLPRPQPALLARDDGGPFGVRNLPPTP